MMEFALFTERACKDGAWATVEKCLQLADRLLRFGDSEINNAVYVSYLEILPRKSEVHDRLRKMMTANLHKGWDDILKYLSKLSRTQSPVKTRNRGIGHVDRPIRHLTACNQVVLEGFRLWKFDAAAFQIRGNKNLLAVRVSSRNPDG